MGILWEFLLFLSREKKYWLIPLVVVLLVVAVFILIFESASVLWFVYPLF